ncbi:MAG: hypothetical protein RL186_31 [Pseudomonadota bacterium]|jgi:hypothetical protein
MTSQQTGPLTLSFIAACFAAAASFLAWQSLRAEAAAVRLDVYKSQRDNPLAIQQLAATQALLAEPRDARLLELESVRLQRLGDKMALREAAALAARAIDQAPARPTLRMHEAFVLAQLNASDALLNQRLTVWHNLAPHDGVTQPWRLALGSSIWSKLGPATRGLLLSDAEDVCVRSGKKRTLDLAQVGQPSARLAIALRLERMARACAQYPADAPPILQ